MDWAWERICLSLAATALLSCCGTRPDAQNGANEARAEGSPRPGGSRLRLPATAEQLRTFEVREDGEAGCSAVDTGEEGEVARPEQARLRNRVEVNARGEILWNGAPVDAPTLKLYLDVVADLPTRPLTIVRTAPGADPRSVEAVRDAFASSKLQCQLEIY